MNNYAFVSYSHRDADKVIPIVEKLRDAGFSLWIDRFELTAGEEWSKSIADALNNAHVLLWFVGKGTATSSWIQLELKTLLQRSGTEVQIIPVLLEGADPFSLPSEVNKYRWIDVRNNVDSALKELEIALDRFNMRQVGQSSPPEKNSGFVFISYSATDRSFLEELKEFLKERKYGYWDFHESKRNYQSQFHLELESIIIDSKAILCIVTPAWKASRWAPREYLFAEDIRNPIFLLRAETLEPTLLIAGSSYIDFVTDKKWAFEELGRELTLAGL